MRRILLVLAMSTAVGIAAPSIALATHRSHHARHHHSHHARRLQHRRFGKSDQSPSSAQQAGTVTSFTNGILTITLNDGSTVSGAVTSDTQLNCVSSSSQGDQGDTSGDSSNTVNDSNDGSDGNSGDGDGEQMCSVNSLAPGTPVAAANLAITSAGNVWDSVDLITTSASSSSGD